MGLTDGCFYKAGFGLAGVSAVAGSVHGLHSENTAVSRVQPVTHKPTHEKVPTRINSKNQISFIDSIGVNMREEQLYLVSLTGLLLHGTHTLLPTTLTST